MGCLCSSANCSSPWAPEAKPGQCWAASAGASAATAACRLARGCAWCGDRACCCGLSPRKRKVSMVVSMSVSQEMIMFGFVGILVILGVLLLFSAVKILPEYQRGVVLTLGRYTG